MSETPGAREVVLGRIRAAIADAPAVVAIPRDYEAALAPDIDVVELFVERVGDYQATVRRATEVTLPAVIADVLAARGVRQLAVPAAIPGTWLDRSDAVRVGDDPPLAWADLDGIDGVITDCAVAIAETGTIILDGGAAQGRRALSLLPDVHVCVVATDRIVGSVPEALARLEPTRPQTWISGPSATSDIELQRIEGVHGPRRLDVIVVEPT